MHDVQQQPFLKEVLVSLFQDSREGRYSSGTLVRVGRFPQNRINVHITAYNYALSALGTSRSARPNVP